MKLLRALVIISVLAAGFAVFPGLPSASAAECYSVSGSGQAGFDPEVGPLSVSAGTTVNAEGTRPVGPVYIEVYGTVSGLLYWGELASPHSVSVDVPTAQDVYVFFGVYGDGDATYSVNTGNCGGTMVNYPESIVQGTFTSDALLYWEPGNLLNPEITVPAGKHVYAGGLDESGMYRQVLIVCDWLWVPVDTIGSNFDYPWLGAPLVDDFPIQSGRACVSGAGASAEVNWWFAEGELTANAS